MKKFSFSSKTPGDRQQFDAILREIRQAARQGDWTLDLTKQDGALSLSIEVTPRQPSPPPESTSTEAKPPVPALTSAETSDRKTGRETKPKEPGKAKGRASATQATIN